MALAIFQSTAVDDAGNVLPNATVEVRSEAPGLPFAQIYSDRAGTINPGNPFNADSDGAFEFYVAGGTYSIEVTSGATTRTFRYVAIGTAAEYDADNLLFSFAVFFALQGLPAIGEETPFFTIPLSMRFDVDFAGSFAVSRVAATAETVIAINTDTGAGTVEVGTITFAAAGTTGTFVAASAVSLSPGDLLWLEFPDPRDTTLAEISVTLLGTRTV